MHCDLQKLLQLLFDTDAVVVFYFDISPVRVQMYLVTSLHLTSFRKGTVHADAGARPLVTSHGIIHHGMLQQPRGHWGHYSRLLISVPLTRPLASFPMATAHSPFTGQGLQCRKRAGIINQTSKNGSSSRPCAQG